LTVTGKVSKVEALRRKNEAFDALCNADAMIHKRAARGTVPASWHERRAQLAAGYDAAVEEWEMMTGGDYGEILTL
jgi:hypothetical protein